MQDLGFNPDSNPHSVANDKAFERRLDQALATAPQPSIPQDFAARVAALVPASKPLPPPKFAYARNSMILSGFALFVALLILAPQATAGSIDAIVFEWILCAELSLLALYVALPGNPVRSAG